MFAKLVAAFLLAAASAALAEPWGIAAPPFLHRGLAVGSPLIGAAAIGTGLEYPAHVTPADCPNFPFCDERVFNPATRVAAVGTLGVGAAICPNYPYCL